MVGLVLGGRGGGGAVEETGTRLCIFKRCANCFALDHHSAVGTRRPASIHFLLAPAILDVLLPPLFYYGCVSNTGRAAGGGRD